MALEWFVQRGNQEEGPFSSSHLKQLADEEAISPDTLVRLGTAGQWVAAGSIEDLFTHTGPIRRPSHPQTSSPAASQPAATQPTATKPAAPQPAASQPAASQPTATQQPTQPAEDTGQWYMQGADGQQYGPVAGAQLDAWVAEGRLEGTFLIWRQGWEQWQPASTVYAQLAAPTPAASAPAAAASPAPQPTQAAPQATQARPQQPRPKTAAKPQAPAEPTLPAGHRLGRFEVLELLGRGRMGTVYKALQPTLDRLVAVRVLPGKRDTNFLQRFRNEIRAAASLNHPNIVEIYDVGQEGDATYVAMELVKGTSLAEILRRRGRLDVGTAMVVLRQATTALAAAHASGVTHRDLKPSSILLGPDGTTKLADFGLMDFVDADSSAGGGQPAARSPYTPPEVLHGEPPDARSDLYSLGATFYHLLSGRAPLAGPTAAAAQPSAPQPLPPLVAVAPGVPQSLGQVIDRLMVPNPAARYSTAADLLSELEKVRIPRSVRKAAAAPQAAAPGAAEGAPAESAFSSRTLLVGGLAGAAIVLVVIVLLLARGCRRDEAPETPAEEGSAPVEQPAPPADPAAPAPAPEPATPAAPAESLSSPAGG